MILPTPVKNVYSQNKKQKQFNNQELEGQIIKWNLPFNVEAIGNIFSLALSLLVTLKGKLHLMIDRCRRSVKKGTLDFGNNIFHGTVVLQKCREGPA